MNVDGGQYDRNPWWCRRIVMELVGLSKRFCGKL
jgi:hypothetical protein